MKKTFLTVKNITQSKVVYELRLLADGSLDKYKARLVAAGFTQVYGLDFFEKFSLAPMIGGVHFVIIYILQHTLKQAQSDVNGAILNSTLKEEMYLRLCASQSWASPPACGLRRV
jgi:hypothetical protein